jgi:putative spermidine/putrescine transport system permease protein
MWVQSVAITRAGGNGSTTRFEKVALAVAALGLAAFFVVTFLWPLLIVLTRSLGSPPWQYYATNLASASVLVIVWRTIRMAAAVTVGCLVLAYPSALALTRLPPQWRGTVLLLILLPAVTSFLVRTYGWMALLGVNGPLAPLLKLAGVPTGSLVGTFPGLILAMVHMLLPLMILPIFAAMRTIPASQLAAAESLGAVPAEAFIRVFVPQSLSGVISGSVLVFVVALGFFVTPALIGGMRETTLAMVIYMYLTELFDWGRSTSLAAILLIVVSVMLALAARATNLWKAFGLREEDTGKRKRAASRLLGMVARLAGAMARRGLLGQGKGRTPMVMLVLTLLVLLLPLAFVVGVSFQPQRMIVLPVHGFSLRWYAVVLSSTRWLDAAATSFEIAFLATAIALVVGYPMASTASRVQRGLRNALSALCLGPAILPLIVLAVGVYGVFTKLGWIGALPAVALAHAGLAVPYVFVNVLNGLSRYNPRLDAAAASLGARSITILRRIKLPLLLPSIAAAAAFAALISLDELVITLFISGAEVRTLPMVMYGAAVQDLSPELAAVGTLLIALVVGVTLAGRLFLFARTTWTEHNTRPAATGSSDN